MEGIVHVTVFLTLQDIIFEINLKTSSGCRFNIQRTTIQEKVANDNAVRMVESLLGLKALK